MLVGKALFERRDVCSFQASTSFRVKKALFERRSVCRSVHARSENAFERCNVFCLQSERVCEQQALILSVVMYVSFRRERVC